MRESIIFYRSFYEAIKELPMDIQSQVYTAVFEYSLNFNEVVLEGLPKAIFTLIKPQLDANNKRYENGKKGGRTKRTETKTEPKHNQESTKVEPNENYNVNANYNDNYILLEKETKEETIKESFTNDDPLDSETDTKEKSSAKKERFDFKKEMLGYGFDSELTEEWMKIRKAKKAINSKIAFSNFISQVEKSDKPPNEILRVITEKQWKGYNSEWLKNLQDGQQTTNKARPNSGHKVSGTQNIIDGIDYFEFT